MRTAAGRHRATRRRHLTGWRAASISYAAAITVAALLPLADHL